MVDDLSVTPRHRPNLRVSDTATDVVDTLGPGRRSVVWVQGCTLHCPGCIVPESWPTGARGRLVDPERLADELLVAHPDADLTVSGGEPTEQAAGVAVLLQTAHRLRRTTWVYTGRTLEELLEAADPDVLTMLASTDVLVDGRFEQDRHDARGYRGSDNQRVLRLTDRIDADAAGSGATGRVDIRVSDGSLLVIGIPSRAFLPALREQLARRGVDVPSQGRWRR